MHSSSLERIYPVDDGSDETIAGSDTVKLHLQRYEFAGLHLLPGKIADAACGSGYGSYLLATKFQNKITGITAIDHSFDAFSFAKTNYQHSLIEFIKENIYTFQSTEPFSTIISLETIEHLENPKKFIKHFSAQLKKGGRFIVSAPVVPTMDANPYHLHDFTVKSFKKLFINSGYTELHSMLQVQHYNPFKLRSKKEKRSAEIRKNLISYYLKYPIKFLLRLKSIFIDGFSVKYLVVVFEKK